MRTIIITTRPVPSAVISSSDRSIQGMRCAPIHRMTVSSNVWVAPLCTCDASSTNSQVHAMAIAAPPTR